MAEEESNSLIKGLFSDRNLSNAIDIKSLIPLSLSTAQSNAKLSHFFALDEDGPFSEIVQRGVQSLRKGFYKIYTRPYYRTNIFPGTFAADVYYYNDHDTLFKYHANIGPLTNTSMLYFPINKKYHSEPIPIVQKFFDDKRLYGGKEDYKVAKENFYNSVFVEGRIIYVRESIWDPAYPKINKRKQVKWSFIDF